MMRLALTQAWLIVLSDFFFLSSLETLKKEKGKKHDQATDDRWTLSTHVRAITTLSVGAFSHQVKTVEYEVEHKPRVELLTSLVVKRQHLHNARVCVDVRLQLWSV